MDRPPPWPNEPVLEQDDGRPEAQIIARLGLDRPDAFAEQRARELVARHVDRLARDAGRVIRDSTVTGTWTDETGRFAWAAAVAVRPDL